MDIVANSGNAAENSIVPSQKRKRTLAELVKEDGPLRIALLIGQAEGRWSFEINKSFFESCREVQSLLSKAAEVIDVTFPMDGTYLLGIAVIRSWRFVHERASSNDTYLLMRAYNDAHRKSCNHRFLEHEVISVASVRQRDGSLIPAAREWTSLDPTYVGKRILTSIENLTGIVRKRTSLRLPYARSGLH